MAEVDRAAVKRQIEFYFSDSNFRKDAFLRAQAEADPNGFVPIKVLLTFNKLKALTTDADLIAEIMADSEVVDVSADKQSIKRSAELPANDDSALRTLYVKGYPTEDAGVTIEAVSAQFSTYGKVLMVRLRREKGSKAFKGSCFVEFDSEKAVADAVAAANADGAVQIGYKDAKFDCVMAYTEWAKRKEAKRKNSGKAGDAGASAGSHKRNSDALKTEEAPTKTEFTAGLIFHVRELPTDANTYEIKEYFKKIADVKFVDYNAGTSEAFVRVADSAASTRVAEALKNGISLRETTAKMTYSVLEGDAEQAYWDKIAAESKNSNRGGRGGGRGGRGFKKARRN